MALLKDTVNLLSALRVTNYTVICRTWIDMSHHLIKKSKPIGHCMNISTPQFLVQKEEKLEN